MRVPCMPRFLKPTAPRVAPRRAPRGLALESLEDRRLLAVLNVGDGSQYATIQSAVDAARPGDVVLVGGGQYTESVDLSRMGAVRGGSIGDLTIRGDSSAVATVTPPTGRAAFFNSVAFSGDLNFERLTISGASAGAGTGGVHLNQLVGDLGVEELVFEQLSDDAIRLAGATGKLWIQSSWFDRVGDTSSNAAIRVAQFSGAAVITANDFDDVRGTVLDLANGSGRESTWLVDDNRIYGDGSLFSTTVTGIRAVLTGNSRTDLVLDSNAFDGLAGSAIVLLAQDQAQLQTRWAVNSATNLQGTAAAQLTLRDAAAGVLFSDTNAWNDLFGSGLAIQAEHAARLRATVQYDAFILIGDGVGSAPDEALTVVTSSNATGSVDLFLFNNTFSIIAGNGVRITAGGTATVRAVIEENFFDETNTVTPGSALIVEHAASTSKARVDLRVDGNIALENQSAAYVLRQRGTAVMRLERAGGSAAAQLADSNIGEPVSITGSVGTLAPGHLDASLPLTLGGTVWWDNGDSIQNQGEQGAGGIVIRLSGFEAGSGLAVNRITQSDASGTYRFPGLAPGQYTLAVHVPFAVRLAAPNQGLDDEADSDFDPASGQIVVVLTDPHDRVNIDAGLWRTWQNPRNPLDVNADGVVVPLDVLLLINDINSRGARPLSLPPLAPLLPPPYLDTNGDGEVGPLDALLVINSLNRGSEGEGEAAMRLSNGFRGDASSLRGGQSADGSPVLRQATRSALLDRWLTVRATSRQSAARTVAPLRAEKIVDEFFAQWGGDWERDVNRDWVESANS